MNTLLFTRRATRLATSALLGLAIVGSVAAQSQPADKNLYVGLGVGVGASAKFAFSTSLQNTGYTNKSETPGSTPLMFGYRLSNTSAVEFSHQFLNSSYSSTGSVGAYTLTTNMTVLAFDYTSQLWQSNQMSLSYLAGLAFISSKVDEQLVGTTTRSGSDTKNGTVLNLGLTGAYTIGDLRLFARWQLPKGVKYEYTNQSVEITTAPLVFGATYSF